VQDVQHLCKICPRKWPASQNFLSLLIDIDDDDPGVGMRKALRPILEAHVQSGEFEPLNEFENRRRPLAHKCQEVNKERKEGDREAE